MKRVSVILIVSLFILLEGCQEDDPSCTKTVPASQLADVNQDRLALDIITIDTYLQTNGITAQTEPNGVRYVQSVTGSGTTPCLESKIKVKYNLKLLGSGTTIESNTTGVSFSLSGLILGWKLVLPIIQSGSIVKLYIPSGYAYGNSIAAGGQIPANANLVFEIELLEVN